MQERRRLLLYYKTISKRDWLGKCFMRKEMCSTRFGEKHNCVYLQESSTRYREDVIPLMMAPTKLTILKLRWKPSTLHIQSQWFFSTRIANLSASNVHLSGVFINEMNKLTAINHTTATLPWTLSLTALGKFLFYVYSYSSFISLYICTYFCLCGATRCVHVWVRERIQWLSKGHCHNRYQGLVNIISNTCAEWP